MLEQDVQQVIDQNNLDWVKDEQYSGEESTFFNHDGRINSHVAVPTPRFYDGCISAYFGVDVQTPSSPEALKTALGNLIAARDQLLGKGYAVEFLRGEQFFYRCELKEQNINIRQVLEDFSF